MLLSAVTAPRWHLCVAPDLKNSHNSLRSHALHESHIDIACNVGIWLVCLHLSVTRMLVLVSISQLWTGILSAALHACRPAPTSSPTAAG